MVASENRHNTIKKRADGSSKVIQLHKTHKWFSGDIKRIITEGAAERVTSIQADNDISGTLIPGKKSQTLQFSKRSHV
ncbi:MAG: hypothetical protein CR981_04140 [Proteobacteria bacterium]|nr:MAG: hypothetical protein CR981_04140 [Pseudomonadota bacterium]